MEGNKSLKGKPTNFQPSILHLTIKRTNEVAPLGKLLYFYVKIGKYSVKDGTKVYIQVFSCINHIFFSFNIRPSSL